MPSVSRSRTIPAPPRRIWDLISDPHNLPRWWPRTLRVEDVQGSGDRSRWTIVLETERGSGVRADFRCTGATNERRLAWTQDLEGTPFAKVLRESTVEILLDDVPEGTRVVLRSSERLRGMARLGGRMIRRAARRRLDEALDGMHRALVADPADAAP